MATITFDIPDDYADEMTKPAGGFRLDVFGWVFDTETGEAIGRWIREA